MNESNRQIKTLIIDYNIQMMRCPQIISTIPEKSSKAFQLHKDLLAEVYVHTLLPHIFEFPVAKVHTPTLTSTHTNMNTHTHPYPHTYVYMHVPTHIMDIPHIYIHGQLTVEFTHVHKVISRIESCRHYNSSVSAFWASSVQRSYEQGCSNYCYQ